ncbi:hypothetical protein ACIRPT_22285 [Streptomyces sp. NPDC101227]|uniref:hypothetical protein n=1 Tax=Streptomyces sp. NPDC101227 TaxID=3366136 RepID=UPI0037F26A56
MRQRGTQGGARRTTPIVAASLMAGLALFATACSGGDEGGSKGGGSDAGGKGKEADAAYKHRQCLRDHGIKVDEPKPGQDPRAISIGGNADPGKMKKAFKACQEGGPGAGANGPGQADKDKMLKFARCMREHGFNMPDPKFDGSGMQQAQRIPKGQEKTFEKANQACGGRNAG